MIPSSMGALMVRLHRNGRLDVRGLGELGESDKKWCAGPGARAEVDNVGRVGNHAYAGPVRVDPVWHLGLDGDRWLVFHKSGRSTSPPPTIPDQASRQWCLTVIRRLQGG